MFMNRREHLLNMKNKYLTKCLCITMAAAISFTGTASVFASEETALSETETAAREAAAELWNPEIAFFCAACCKIALMSVDLPL